MIFNSVRKVKLNFIAVFGLSVSWNRRTQHNLSYQLERKLSHVKWSTNRRSTTTVPYHAIVRPQQFLPSYYNWKRNLCPLVSLVLKWVGPQSLFSTFI